VVAEEEYGADTGVTVGSQSFNHLRGVWATIDQVTDKDDQGIARRPLGKFAVDPLEKPVEQVEPAVNVADDIGSVTARARGKLLFSCEIEHALASSPKARLYSARFDSSRNPSLS
jgi:hypothetical protein